jgi:ABC-2 type transport system ATP-binding protein
LQFSEAITTLTGRFRQVELTFESRPASKPQVPPTWMEVELSTGAVRLVETRFDQERTTSEIHRTFGQPKSMTILPMSLRSIFLVMARAGRATGENV